MPYECSKYSLKVYIFISVKSLIVVDVNQSKAYIVWRRPNNNSQKPVIATVYISIVHYLNLSTKTQISCSYCFGVLIFQTCISLYISDG